MLTTETESRLSKLLLVLADGEASCEVTRQVLANQNGFDAYNLFRLLDVENKGWVDCQNLQDFMRRHGVFMTSNEAANVIYHFDSDQNGNLSYSEWANLVVSPRSSWLKNSSRVGPWPVPYDVEFSLVRLLEKELDLVKNLRNAVVDCCNRYDFTVSDSYRAIDVYNLSNLTSDSLRKFLVRNFVTPSDQDLDNIVRRLDTNMDFRVSPEEWRAMFASYGCSGHCLDGSCCSTTCTDCHGCCGTTCTCTETCRLAGTCTCYGTCKTTGKCDCTCWRHPVKNTCTHGGCCGPCTCVSCNCTETCRLTGTCSCYSSCKTTGRCNCTCWRHPYKSYACVTGHHGHHSHHHHSTSSHTHLHYSPLRRTFYYSPCRTRLHCSPRRCHSPLRTFYSPPKKVTSFSAMRSGNLNQSQNLNTSLNLNQTKTSPLRQTQQNTSSPKRVSSPPRTQNLSQTRSSPLRETQNNLNQSQQLNKSCSRFPSLEEEVFHSFLRDLLSVESSLENNKNEVALKSDYNMEDVFSIFEKYNKGHVTEFDLKDGLNSYFGLFPLLEEISALYKRYDCERLGALSYGDFFNMCAPVCLDYRRLVENRTVPNSTLVGDPLSVSTKYAVKNMFANLLSAEQTLEAHRLKMKNMLSFNAKKVFELIGGYGSNYFSERDFMLYLDRNGISYNPRDIELVFIRFSRNKKGLISFTQFLEEVSPRF